MKVPITQSKEWQKLQEDLGETSYYKKKENYTYLAILKSTPVGKYLYLPYGPVFRDHKSFSAVIQDLTSIAKKQQAIFIRIEPTDASIVECLPRSARKTKDLNPKETWQLDLDGSDEDLRQKLPSRLLRYYRGAEKKGLTIETSHRPEDIKYLLRLQKELADRKGINTFSEHYLQTELCQPFATLYLVKHQTTEDGNSEIVAAGLVFDDDTTRYNLQGAQNDTGRKLHATGILTVQLILDAKAKKLKTFDFWGIAPEGASSNHPWAGFTNFKKTFAGHEVDYAGTYDVILSPFRYRLYQFFRKLNLLLRK